MSRRLSGMNSALRVLMLGGFGAMVRWFLSAFVTDGAWISVLTCFHALSFAATHLGAVTLMSELVGPMRRAQAQGWLQGAIAMTTALAILTAGHYYNALGTYIYFGMAAMALCGLMLALRMMLWMRH